MYLTKFASREAAREAFRAGGYSVFLEMSSAGDYGYGSREYYQHEDAALAIAEGRCSPDDAFRAEISLCPGGWSTFDLTEYGQPCRVYYSDAE